MSIAIIFALAMQAPAVAQTPAQPFAAEAPAAGSASVVRRFTAAGVDPALARAELLALGRTASQDDLVDLVTEFVPTYGQATNVVPANLGGSGMMSVLYQFREERSIVVTVHAPQPAHLVGPHACRILIDASRGRPEPAQFARIVHWCANAVTLSNLDPTAVAREQQ